ncbi:MAG: hypothetical protein WAM60_15210 [Candidatus Promineifilaceae bacterium]
MDLLVLILRLIHIFGAFFWAGGSFMMVSFIEPTVMKTGEEGKKFMQYLGSRTRLSASMGVAAVLTILSGLILYYRLFHDDFGAVMSSGYGVFLSFGALFGLLGWVAGFYFSGRASSRMKALSEEIEAAGGPPTAEQAAEMQALAKQLTMGGRITATFLTLALIGMAGAEAAG